MTTVNIRELLHHFSTYLKAVKAGERIVILERHNPVAEIIPHNENIEYPGWKKEIKKIKVCGETFAETTRKNRESER